ncbi:MAG TPA: DUF6350 family protein [Actinoplanes sp.]|nr:DUF6350 family protein [Actinoplanes sp.]
MPTTPDRPDGRSAGSGDERVPTEPAEPAVESRETVRVDTANHETRRVDTANHETRRVDPANHKTRRVDVRAGIAGRPTVPLDRETVQLPGQRKAPDRAGRAPLIVAAGFATLWAALVSYLPVAAVIGLARTLEGAGGLGGAATAGLAAWLLGHGVPLGTSIGPLALAPLLLTLLAAWRLNRAGLHVTRAIGARHSGSTRAALLVAGVVGFWYAVLGALAASVISRPGMEVAAGRTALNLFVIGAAGAAAGSLRSTGALGGLARTVPPALRHGIRTGMVACLLILAAGAAFAGLSVAVGGGEAADMIAAYRTGVAGQAGITLVSLAYGGNSAVWAAAYLLGPGFSLGADSSVRVTEVAVGPLPTLPLLSGLPSGPMGATGALLLAVPVVAGLYAGWLLTQRITGALAERAQAARARLERAQTVRIPTSRPTAKPDAELAPWPLLFGAALIAGPVGGLLLGLLAWVSGGSLGGGRLAQIGPVPWQVALVTTGVVAVSATLGAALARTIRPPRR